MNKPLLKSKLWMVVTGALLLSAFNVSAQTCVVGGTDFDTDAALFDPILANDETGWFNEDVGDELDALCGTCQYYEETYKGKHLGMPSNSMKSDGALFTAALWTTILANENIVPNTFLGGSAIVTNPKLIDPRLKEFHNKMFVNAGATHEKAIFSYTVSGLAPNSTVVFTADIYNLLDLESAAEYANANSITTEFEFGGYTYNVTQDQFYGNTSIAINGSTAVNVNGAVTGGVSTGTIGWGASKEISITGTTDGAGTVTFYLGRPGGINFAPIGVDNIEIKGTIKPEITSQKILPVCQANPVLLVPKHTYPAGTTYSWSTTPASETSSSQYFSFTPGDLPSYTVNLSIALPGCAAATANAFELTTKACCSEDVGGVIVPTASTYVFYDDFGMFPSKSTFEWRSPDGTLNIGNRRFFY